VWVLRLSKNHLILGEVESLTLVTFLYSFKLFRVVYIFTSLVFNQTTKFETRLK
jgi:hypothetical protein